MPVYDFICHKCKLFFEKEYSMKNAPTKSRCPECNKLSNQNYQQVAVHFKGECYTNKRLSEKSKTNNFELGRLGDTLVNKTKQSLDTAKTSDFYTKYVPNKNFTDVYGGRHIESKELEERNRRAASIGKTTDTLGSYHKHQSPKPE